MCNEDFDLRRAVTGQSARPHQVDEAGRAAKREVLRALAEDGCIFCNDQLRSSRNYFFWYVAESYSEPETIHRVQRSLGFCRRHTGELVAGAPRSTLSSVYRSILLPYLAALETAGTNSLTAKAFRQLIANLQPSASCPACETEQAAQERQGELLRRSLGDVEVQAAFAAKGAICIQHLLSVAPLLGWQELRHVSDSVLRHLP